MKTTDIIFVAFSIGVSLLLIAGCSRAEEPDEYVTKTANDRVCVAESAHLYADPELTNPLSPRMLKYWEFAEFVESDESGKAEFVISEVEWWVSTEEVRPVYRVTKETELLVPKLVIPDDGGETVEHMGILDYLEPGELVALSVQPISTLGGYLLVETEDCQSGFVLEDAIEPFGDPGR